MINLLFLLRLTHFFTSHSQACDCIILPVSEEVKISDVIFSGRVLSLTSTNNLDSLGVATTAYSKQEAFDSAWLKIPMVIIKMAVDTFYKSRTTTDTLTILTAYYGATCGYRFSVGQQYIVYATREEMQVGGFIRKTSGNRVFFTNQCTRTQPWNRDEEEAIRKTLNK